MNPFPLQAAQTEITVHWAIHGRGMMNSLNPLDHPWNFDSATVAKHRLKAITASDRKANGDGKWVKIKDRDTYLIPWQMYGSAIPAGEKLLKQWEREDKARYRWKWR